MSTVFDVLAEVERRPGMYFSGLEQLEAMLYGYSIALSNHSIDEAVPNMSHFARWLGRETGWSMSCGWAAAFNEHVCSDQHAERFFRFVARFERLRPVCVAAVDLQDHHQPTGQRVVIGFGRRTNRPDRIEAVQYQPESLHFLRFVEASKTTVGPLLEVNRPDRGLDLETNLNDVKAWVAAEFQVEAEAWDVQALHGKEP